MAYLRWVDCQGLGLAGLFEIAQELLYRVLAF